MPYGKECARRRGRGEGADSHAARFWNGEAAKLLAPLLNAAALGNRGIDAVIQWLDTQAVDEPVEILEVSGERPAQRQLGAFASLDSRTRSSVGLDPSTALTPHLS